MEKISLKGGEIHYTKSMTDAYKVCHGTALAYLVPFTGEESGRRMLLGRLSEGEMCMGFFHDSELLGCWKIGFAALDEAELSLEEGKADDGLYIECARKFMLPNPVMEPGKTIGDLVGECLIEHYNRMAVKEKGYIFATQKEKGNTREKSLRVILDYNTKQNYAGIGELIHTKNPVYDAAAAICLKTKIDIASPETIRECCGRRFTVADVARVSHFVIREIRLEGKWWKKDCGAVFAYRKEDRAPVAAIPCGPCGYKLYDPVTEETVKLTDEIGMSLDDRAFCFYRPFPSKAMSVKDLLLFGFANVYRSDIVRLFLMALLGTLTGLLIPTMNKLLYDRFIPMGYAAGLVQVGILMLACSMGNICFSVVKNLASFRSMNSMEYAVQSAVYQRLFNLPESFYREYDSAALGQRAMGVTKIFDVLAQNMITSVLAALFSILYLFRMFSYSAIMSVWALFLLTLLIAFFIFMGIKQIRYERALIKAGYESQSTTYQFLSGISKIRIAGAEDRALLKYVEKLVKCRKLFTKKGDIGRIVSAIAGSIPILFSLVFYYLMIRRQINLSVGSFAAFMSAFGAFSSAFITIAQNFLSVNHIKPLYEDIRPILETLPESSEGSRTPGDISGEIQADGVTFAYDEKEEPVLRDINLHINPGEYVGIVGASGCGKSTLLKVLLGFEKPGTGKVYYDSMDIDDLDKQELRKKFGVVLQQGGLISGSIFENITITSPGMSVPMVESIIKAVGLDEDIKNMPMGLNTVISEGAGTISGGQKQRILIARAIASRPKIIFLDEATSALDNVTQAQVVETLERFKATKVVIAHRLSTVQNCDRIIVMDKGMIVEEGSYKELMEAGGMFYELAKRQL